MRVIEAEKLVMKDLGNGLYLVDKEAIRNAPTFEADPVKYGHWIDNADSYICSECRYETDNPNKNPCGPGRCPKCFAKMDVRKPDCRTCTYFAGGAGSFECTGCADHSSWEERK